MRITSIAIVLLGLFMAPFTTVQAQDVKADDVVGVWLTQYKDSKVEIYKDGGKYFGKIIWLETPIDSITGKPKVDDKNEDPNLRNRPIMGMKLLENFVFDGDDEWEDGTIYDPKKGKTYSCYMEFPDKDNKDRLKIRGYIGVSLLGRTVYWTRVKK
ncbi:MAG TPA: DUF2147 domain-containing protein [Bacteroidetes bacterium]|nr:DUF2147 domain-containing protein [Bacteroidota bacterium]